MIGVDTNVLVRLVVDDDRAQADRAQALLASESAWVAKTVLLELEWVLRFTYELDRRRVRGVLDALASTEGIELEDREQVVDALVWYAHGVDLGDALHLSSTPSGARFATFDRKLRNRAHRLDGVPEVVVP